MEQPRVQFQVAHIIHPQVAEVLAELYRSTLLRGEVIGTTYDRYEQERFLVVQVPELSEPVIVPARAVSFDSQEGCPTDAPLLVSAPDAAGD